MKYTVYILYSFALDKFYIGYTGDEISIRLSKHNAYHKGFTGRQNDWMIKYTEEYESKAEAIKREKQIKGWKSRVKIQKLISTE
jgi:putative endonuclease